MKKSKMILMAVVASLCIAMLGLVVYADEQAPVIGVLPEGITFLGESLAGLTVEEAKAKVADYAEAALDRTVEIELQDASYIIAMDAIGMEWKNEKVADQLDGKELQGNVIARYKQKKDIEKNPIDLKVDIAYDADALEELIAGYVEECSSEAKEASMSRVNGEFIVENGGEGISFDAEQIQKDVEKLLKEKNAGEITYTAEAEVVEPENGADVFEGFRGDILGHYSTVYDATSESRSNNIRVAAGSVTGHYYLPGEEFSMLSLVGVVDKSTGYLEAGTYENGAVVQGIGGGICQLATTIYDAALRAELEITERRNHSMVASYVPYAWDAMVYAQGGRDFKFINNTGNPIYIEVGVQEHAVHQNGGDSVLSVYIYGTEYRPGNRTIDFRSVTLDKKWPDACGMPMYNVVVDASLGAGKHKEEAAAHPAVSAECWKDIYVDGVLQESVLINKSVYEPGTGVMHVGPGTSFKSWSIPGKDGWPEIFQDIKNTKAEEEAKKAAEAAKKAEEESKKAAEEASKKAEEEAAQQPAPEPAPAPEASGEGMVDAGV